MKAIIHAPIVGRASRTLREALDRWRWRRAHKHTWSRRTIRLEDPDTIDERLVLICIGVVVGGIAWVEFVKWLVWGPGH